MKKPLTPAEYEILVADIETLRNHRMDTNVEGSPFYKANPKRLKNDLRALRLESGKLPLHQIREGAAQLVDKEQIDWFGLPEGTFFYHLALGDQPIPSVHDKLQMDECERLAQEYSKRFGKKLTKERVRRDRAFYIEDYLKEKAENTKQQEGVEEEEEYHG